MLHLLLLAGAGALFLAGCSKRNSVTLSEPPQNSEPKYLTDFGEDAKAAELFLKLQNAGTPPRLLDQGCPTIVYDSQGKGEIKRFDSGNKKIETCEVYEYVLNEESNFPRLAEELTEKPNPWSFDDRDPKTKFDEEVRRKVRYAIDEISGLLKDKGFAKGSLEYQERMAVGIFYLAATPRLNRIPGKEAAQHVESFLGGLDKFGLRDFKIFLRNHGGFGVEGFYTEEQTALKAMESGVGEGTELCKILFACLRMAGLDPFFVLVPIKKDDPAFQQFPSSLLKEIVWQNPNYRHLCLGLRIGGKTRLLDPGGLRYDPPYREFYPLSLRQYLSLDFINRANEHFVKRELVHALVDLNTAIQIDRENYLAYTNRAIAWSVRGIYGLALEDINRAIQINPAPPSLYYTRGLQWYGQEKFDQALADFNRAIQKDPAFHPAYLQRGILWLTRDAPEKAWEDLAHYIKFNPSQLSPQVAQVLQQYYAQEWMGQAADGRRKIIEEETDLDVINSTTTARMTALLWRAGFRIWAKDHAENLLEVILKKKVERDRGKKEFSPETGQFLTKLLDQFPPDLQLVLNMESVRKKLFPDKKIKLSGE